MEAYPKCLKCEKGVLLPLSDTSFDQPRICIQYKTWVCSNPNCDYEVSLRSGQVMRGQQPRDQKSH